MCASSFCCFEKAQVPSDQATEAMKKARAMSRDEVRAEIRKLGGASGFLKEMTRGLLAVSPIVVNEFTEIVALRSVIDNKPSI
jgi:hypothetical protein